MDRRRRIFLLSPANSSGIRAGLVLRPGARFELALAVQSARGAPLGEVFRFASGLYFRGKLAYEPVLGATLKGKRPERLTPVRWGTG